MSRRRGRARELVETELELMPMLNVFMAIIPLLLLSAAFVPVAVIQASLPGTASAATPAAAEKAPTSIRIFIRAESYLVTVDGTTVAAVARPAGGVEATRNELAACLAAIARAHPKSREVQIVSEPTTRYFEIIRVMDIARGSGLPDAALVEAESEAS